MQSLSQQYNQNECKVVKNKQIVSLVKSDAQTSISAHLHVKIYHRQDCLETSSNKYFNLVRIYDFTAR